VPPQKAVAKLLAEGLIEEIHSRGSLPMWRRDDDDVHSLRIAKKGLAAIQVEDEPIDEAAGEAPKKPPGRSVSRRKSIAAPTGPWDARREACPVLLMAIRLCGASM
jgi:hypothetical protein